MGLFREGPPTDKNQSGKRRNKAVGVGGDGRTDILDDISRGNTNKGKSKNRKNKGKGDKSQGCLVAPARGINHNLSGFQTSDMCGVGCFRRT